MEKKHPQKTWCRHETYFQLKYISFKVLPTVTKKKKEKKDILSPCTVKIDHISSWFHDFVWDQAAITAVEKKAVSGWHWLLGSFSVKYMIFKCSDSFSSFLDFASWNLGGKNNPTHFFIFYLQAHMLFSTCSCLCHNSNKAHAISVLSWTFYDHGLDLGLS